MANIANLRMGPCSLTFNTVDVGLTLGGVKVNYERKLTDLKADKYGENAIDAALTSTELTVEVKVAEPVVQQIKNAIPEGAFNSGPLGEQLGFGAGEGTSMRASAAQLTLHPLSKAATDYSEDLTVYLAYPSSPVPLNYEVANQRVFEVTFSALVSEAYTVGRRLGHIGPVNIS